MWLVLLVCVPAYQAAMALSTIDRVEDYIRSRRAQEPYNIAPGITAVVIVDGTAHTFGSGVQTLGQQHPADEETLMEVGSVTKTFVGLALASLVGRGGAGHTRAICLTCN